MNVEQRAHAGDRPGVEMTLADMWPPMGGAPEHERIAIRGIAGAAVA